jgi:hypothetical protein
MVRALNAVRTQLRPYGFALTPLRIRVPVPGPRCEGRCGPRDASPNAWLLKRRGPLLAGPHRLLARSELHAGTSTRVRHSVSATALRPRDYPFFFPVPDVLNCPPAMSCLTTRPPSFGVSVITIGISP